MAAGGIDQVRVERLAAGLNVTKGSFYWNFKDREDLLDALLSEWERKQTAQIIEASGTELPGAKRLVRLFQVVAGKVSIGLEAAVHAWAQRDERVARRVAAIEKQRIEFIERQFVESGFSPDEAGRRAETAYLVYLGWVDWGTRKPELRGRARPFAQYLAQLLMPPKGGSS